MSYFINTRWAGSIVEPNQSQMAETLSSLDKEDQEHPDVSLVDENGWSLSCFGSGHVVFENVETGEGPWHMKAINKEKMLSLWKSIAEKNIAAVKSEPWASGYGS